jgi:hypothetical protein
MADEVADIRTLQTCVRFSGELLVPGGSNLANGDLMRGGIYAGVGLVAKMLFGLPGLLLVSTDSFLKSTTGRHLYEHAASVVQSPRPGPGALLPATSERDQEGPPSRSSSTTARKVNRSRSKRT